MIEHVEAVLGLQPARLAAHVHHADAGRVVDEDVGLGQPAEGAGDAVPLAVIDLA